MLLPHPQLHPFPIHTCGLTVKEQKRREFIENYIQLVQALSQATVWRDPPHTLGSSSGPDGKG